MSNPPTDPFNRVEIGTPSQNFKPSGPDGNIQSQPGIEFLSEGENRSLDSWPGQEQPANGVPSPHSLQMPLELEAEIDSDRAAEEALLMRYGLNALHLSPELNSTGQPGTLIVNGSKVLQVLFDQHHITDCRRSW